MNGAAHIPARSHLMNDAINGDIKQVRRQDLIARIFVRDNDTPVQPQLSQWGQPGEIHGEVETCDAFARCRLKCSRKDQGASGKYDRLIRINNENIWQSLP